MAFPFFSILTSAYAQGLKLYDKGLLNKKGRLNRG
jgi:hypothetical protein